MVHIKSNKRGKSKVNKGRGQKQNWETRIGDAITFDLDVQPTYFFGSLDGPHSGLSGDVNFFKIGPREHTLRHSRFFRNFGKS